ncbi:MAG: 16S rRNA (cytosine(1402)-N(4))-methyltransferase RsmH, partial [Aggregatilineales bacterium]
IDRDPQALSVARERLSRFGDRAVVVHASYDQLGILAPAEGFGVVDGILFDLGLSSLQLDDGTRGFAFRTDAPLDMRFDPTSDGPTAADLVNTLSESELADMLYEYGDEPASRRIARVIVAARPLQTTTTLAEVIARAVPSPRGHKIHPATRSFQALRIAVNDELGVLKRTLPVALDLLKPGGRLVVISFHSLEDRIVKQFMKREATDCLCPPHQPICTCGHRASIELITRKPIEANETEVADNPRSRSARLRIAQKRTKEM